MLFDTHAHPYITFKKSPEAILENFFRDPNNRLVSIACDIKTSIQSIELAEAYPWVYATIWYHPCDLPYASLNSGSAPAIARVLLQGEIKLQNAVASFPLQGKEFKIEVSWDTHNTSLNSLLQGEIKLQIQELKNIYQKHKKHIVAVWETGLDYYHLASISEKSWLWESVIKQIQAEYFRAQIRLAQELELPFVIHSRESNDDVLAILSQEQASNYVFHCFSWDIDFAHKVLEQNPQAMFWLGWPLTFRKSHALHELARKLPLKHILIETDAPFLTPEPLRGREENEPLYVSHILAKLQELRDESPDEIEKMVYENGKKFYAVD